MSTNLSLAAATRRVLRSPMMDLLVGPHGVDRYLELIRPSLALSDARAEVTDIRRQTARSVTLMLRPNSAWRGFRAGQFVPIGVEIDGVRRTRTYSPACSELDDQLELTATVHPGGLVSAHLAQQLKPGAIVHLGEAAGEFVLPDGRPDRLVLISGGSGITPVLSMLRSLCDRGHAGEVTFVHYARTAADWLYRLDVQALAARHRNVRVEYVATREDGRRVSRATIGEAEAVAVCGPPPLIEAVKAIRPEAIAETFAPPATGAAVGGGTVTFLSDGRSAPVGRGTLLEQAEAAGLAPDFGCRMGICHTCTCRKRGGAVKNLLTGEVSAEEDEDIQLCISVPAGDVALEI